MVGILHNVAGFLRHHLRYAVREHRQRHKNKSERVRAHRILSTIEAQIGGLSSSVRREIRDYCLDTLGGLQFAPWLEVYSAMQGEFRPGWIPNNYWGTVMKPRLKGPYGDLSGLNSLNRLITQSEAFPSQVSHVNGLFLDGSLGIIEPERVRDHLFQTNEKTVFKTDNSSSGSGIYMFTEQSFDVAAIRGLGNGSFQPYITQHSDISVFGKSAVAPIRITTAVDSEGVASVRAAYIRFGRASEKWTRSESQIRVSIDLGAGILREFGWNYQWLRSRTHPDTGAIFEGFVVPNFLQAKSLVLELQKKVPFVRSIGWDIAIDESGSPIVMEWNGKHNDIKFSEAVDGPCFSDLLYEVAGHPQ